MPSMGSGLLPLDNDAEGEVLLFLRGSMAQPAAGRLGTASSADQCGSWGDARRGSALGELDLHAITESPRLSSSTGTAGRQGRAAGAGGGVAARESPDPLMAAGPPAARPAFPEDALQRLKRLQAELAGGRTLPGLAVG